MFAHILCKKFMTCSAFLHLEEQTDKQRVIGRLILPLESHQLPQLPSVVTTQRTTLAQPGLPSRTHQTWANTPVPEHFWSGTVSLCCSQWQRAQENGGTVPRQATLTFQKSSLHVAKPTAHTLDTLGTTPSTCLLLHVRQGWPQTYLRLGRKLWFTFRYQNTTSQTMKIAKLPWLFSYPFLHSHPNLHINFWQTVSREQQWCARYYES